MTGKIITIEGIDKAGKSTQSIMLRSELLNRGIKCQLMDFPNYTNKTGVLIYNMLDDGSFKKSHEMFHMLMSANRWEDVENINWFLEDNNVIIMDRYWQSNLVYGTCNNMSPAWLKMLDQGLPPEVLTIVIDIEPKISFDRATDRDSLEANSKLLTEARSLYKDYGLAYGWKTVNGDRPKKEVAKDIINHVEAVLV